MTKKKVPFVADEEVTGIATVFGLNYNGTPDKGDNGRGVWGAHTDNETILGAAIPEAVMLLTFGFSGTWRENAAAVGKYLHDHKIQVEVSRKTLRGKTIVVDVVDAGPARSYKGKIIHHALDLTYAAAHALQTNGEAVVSYRILKDGKPMIIKGWDRANGCEVELKGVA